MAHQHPVAGHDVHARDGSRRRAARPCRRPPGSWHRRRARRSFRGPCRHAPCPAFARLDDPWPAAAPAADARSGSRAAAVTWAAYGRHAERARARRSAARAAAARNIVFICLGLPRFEEGSKSPGLTGRGRVGRGADAGQDGGRTHRGVAFGAGRGRTKGAAAAVMAAQAIMQSSAMRWPLPWSGMGWPAQCDAIGASCPAIACAMPIRPKGASTNAARTKSWMMRRRLTWASIGLRAARANGSEIGADAEHQAGRDPDFRRRGGRCGRCGRAGGCS